MNAVEIEEAISALAERPFDPQELRDASGTGAIRQAIRQFIESSPSESPISPPPRKRWDGSE